MDGGRGGKEQMRMERMEGRRGGRKGGRKTRKGGQGVFG